MLNDAWHFTKNVFLFSNWRWVHLRKSGSLYPAIGFCCEIIRSNVSNYLRQRDLVHSSMHFRKTSSLLSFPRSCKTYCCSNLFVLFGLKILHFLHWIWLRTWSWKWVKYIFCIKQFALKMSIKTVNWVWNLPPPPPHDLSRVFFHILSWGSNDRHEKHIGQLTRWAKDRLRRSNGSYSYDTTDSSDLSSSCELLIIFCRGPTKMNLFGPLSTPRCSVVFYIDTCI